MSKQIIITFENEAIGVIEGYKVLKELYQDKYPMIDSGRIRFDRDKMQKVFAKDIISKAHQKYPVDIIVSDGEDTLTLRNAWIKETSECTYSSKDYCIIDRVVFVFDGVDV